MRIERFEDIDAWKEARKLVNIVYALSNEGEFSRDFGLKNQFRGASVSIMSNIAEGLTGEQIENSYNFLL